jgi:phosphatidylglycerophosphate synthase
VNLHRSDAKPQWQGLAPSQHNQFQRLAAVTHGIITPGNVLTVLGFAVAGVGLVAILHDQFGWGVVGIISGRLLDIADGIAADKTGTKSPLGETLDASVDKLVTLLTLVVLGMTSVMSWYLFAAILLIQSLITLISGLAVWRNQRLHPSLAGKLSMTGLWVTLGGLVAAYALDKNNLLIIIFYTIGWCSVILSGWAMAIYFRDYRSR